ncbi:oligosaccharide flippase family protein [Rhodanobacter sp. L36]|uniref:oligosaccharide flippase family protein n=1 Tax=Rhodanobacter sp. L36 TaxID=1747221 RepID=UPI00131E139D|nr:oligosaccharide flippase family protein [Rhodanobacter sp. L36]
MTNRVHTLRNTVFSSIGIYTEYFLGMVAAILIARHLGPQHYGIYSLFIWFAAIGVVATNSGVTTGVIKFVAELRGSKREDLIVPALVHFRKVQAWHMAVVVGGGAVLFFVAGHRLIADLNLLEFLLLAAAVGMRAPYMFNIAIAKGFEAFDATAKITMIASPLNLLMVIAAMLLKAPLEWFVIVYAISSAMFLLASQLQVARLVKPLTRGESLPDELLRRMRRHLRIVSATIILSFLIASDVEILFLNLYATPTQAGYFKVAYQLATGVVLLVPGVFGAVLLPMMAKALSEGREIAGRRFVAATSYLTLLSAPVLAFGISFAVPIIALLYGNAYAAAAPVFALVILNSGISTCTQGASSLLVSADRQNTILLLTVIFGALKLALDLILVRHFGLYGAVAAIMSITLISSTTYVTIGVRVSGTRLQWRRLSSILAAAVIASLLALPTFWLHLKPLWTLLIGGVILSAAYLLMTLLLKCWSGGDIEQLQGLHRRFVGGRPLALGKLLAWAGDRSGASR